METCLQTYILSPDVHVGVESSCRQSPTPDERGRERESNDGDTKVKAKPESRARSRYRNGSSVKAVVFLHEQSAPLYTPWSRPKHSHHRHGQRGSSSVRDTGSMDVIPSLSPLLARGGNCDSGRNAGYRWPRRVCHSTNRVLH